MTSPVRNVQRDEAPDLDLGLVALPGEGIIPRADLEAQGYVIGFGEDLPESEYRADPCKHPSLNQSLAKVIARECPDDAWRQHPKGGNVRLETTAAMDESSLFDQLLTGDLDYSASDSPAIWKRPKGKPKKNGAQEYDEISYNDWQGFRVIDADGFTTCCARECRDDARAKRLTPVLHHKFVKAIAEAQEMRVRLELAGIDLRAGKRQVPIYWVEVADDGTPVQCRGKLDQLELAEAIYIIRDLKAVESLNRRAFARQIYNNGWHIQNAAYTSAVEKVTGEFGRVRFEWAAVRKGLMPAAARREASGELLAIGRAEWRFAINTWARCLKAGLFPGYELAGLERVEAEPWMMSRALELEGSDEAGF